MLPRTGRQANDPVTLPSPVGGASRSARVAIPIDSIGKRAT